MKKVELPTGTKIENMSAKTLTSKEIDRLGEDSLSLL